MIAAVLWLGLAQASDDSLLAPTLADFDRSLARVERLVEEANTEAARLGQSQADWVAIGCMTGPCDAARAATVAVTVQEAGHRDRELIQGARAELTRLTRVADEPTVSPLVDAPRRARLERAQARATAAASTWSVRVAWYKRYIAPWVASHPAAVAAACVPARVAP